MNVGRKQPPVCTICCPLSHAVLKMLFPCKNEEADTRLVLHACRQDRNVVFIPKDTDVLILLVYAYELVKSKCSCHMKIDISKVHAFPSSRISRRLPQIHAITRCEATSFFYGIGKVKILKKLKDRISLPLLKEIGRLECLSKRRIN